MVKARQKLKISFDIKTFLVIFTTVGSISFRGANIVNKIENVSIAQAKQQEVIENLIAKRDVDHKVIDQQLAWIGPAVNLIFKKLGL